MNRFPTLDCNSTISEIAGFKHMHIVMLQKKCFYFHLVKTLVRRVLGEWKFELSTFLNNLEFVS